jgi:hypothetical protein
MTASVQQAVGPNGRRQQAGETHVSVVISAYTEERWDQLRDAGPCWLKRTALWKSSS